MTNVEAMVALARHAKAFAKCYVALAEALIAEGVPEDRARQEARTSAVMMSMVPAQEGEACPLCGRGE